jgi:hypothetical protein
MSPWPVFSAPDRPLAQESNFNLLKAVYPIHARAHTGYPPSKVPIELPYASKQVLFLEFTAQICYPD